MAMSTTSGTLLERDAAILASACTVAELRCSLDLWKQAEAAVATSQSYTIAGRALTRADAAEIRSFILLYARAATLAEAASSGRPASRFVSARFTGGLSEHG